MLIPKKKKKKVLKRKKLQSRMFYPARLLFRIWDEVLRQTKTNSWRVSGRWAGRCRVAQLASIRQMRGQVSRGSSARYSPAAPSGSSQCTSPMYFVSCIKPGLVIRFTYDILHVSMLFSQIILALSHRVQKTAPYICVSLLSRIQGYYYHLSKFHIYALLLLLLSRFSCVQLCVTP